MEAIQTGLGFILGVIIFLVMLSKLRVWFISYYSLVFFFIISLALGVILAKVLSWFIIILIVIGVVIYIYMKLTAPPKKEDGDTDQTSSDETSDNANVNENSESNEQQ